MVTKVKTLKIVRRAGIVAVAALLSCSIALSLMNPKGGSFAEPSASSSDIRRVNGVDSNLSSYFDSSVVYSLPDTVGANDYISLIVNLETDTLLSSYAASGSKAGTVGEYALSSAGKAVSTNILRESSSMCKLLSDAGVPYELGASYDTVLGGFEITVKAKYFDTVDRIVSARGGSVIVGEEYAPAETQVVENDVNVYDTGIFDSSDSQYDGTGTVIAVLDTGLDYTHSAFDVSRWYGEELMTTASINQVIRNGGLSAATTTNGLTASDVYLNAKVPYAYDYADKDPDVFPIQSEHGTHVAGIIVGNDDTITGVAPNAQLVMMKVFSDESTGAKTSWLLAALNDCVKLGVDVINMSLGSSCGFSREVDEVAVSEVYDAIEEAGISLVVAASNSYNSTYGSEKNGNLGLTSNPDSATVGSPATYEAALAVASVSGIKTYYLKYEDRIIYFTESSNKAAKQKEFVNEILVSGETEKEFEYITIPGIGLSADYTGLDVTGKIALVKRGTSSFEDKARVALSKGAAGLIVYNNVSGEIGMTVGNVYKTDGNPFPVCSISQDDGEILAANSTGKITISKNQAAGPFMSNFSSWGPTPDLRIKPEITAHGGDILSAVPGQDYDRLSGTSMAAPNQAGVTALIRQYVKENFSNITKDDPVAIAALVNQIMMSTTDIAKNTNGLPYSVRKQGAGLANLTKATSSPAYLTTYDVDGNLMSKTKLELGDDAKKTGVYTMIFNVNNTKGTALTYDVDAIVMTEGVSETLTYKGDTTVTEKGYLLGASIAVQSVSGGSQNGNKVTVQGNGTATVKVVITLTDEDKSYLDANFSNGMYVEGFITLTASDGTTIDLSVPFLGFYGDWTQAPVLDLDYFETNKDELDNTIAAQDKTLPDAYATRPIGGLYNDYIAYLGSYMYIQDPSTPQISASREHIALTNQTGSSGGINSISSIWAGMLRGAKQAVVTITDSSTGEVVFTKTVYNQRKSYNYGSAILSSSIDVSFNIADYDLPNNGQYLFQLVTYVDYGDGGLETNVRNTFEFPFVVDYEAPVVTNVVYSSEYDRTNDKTRLYAEISIYDNHYTQAASIGTIFNLKDENSPYYDPTSSYTYSLYGFSRYLTPVTSSFNSTATIKVELTDNIRTILDSYNHNSFYISVIDYAGNEAMYELSVPSEIFSISFKGTDADGVSFGDRFEWIGEDEQDLAITLYLNETFSLDPKVNLGNTAVGDAWKETLVYTSEDETIAAVVAGKLVARQAGQTVITATAQSGETTRFIVTVDDSRSYSKAVAASYKLTQFTVNKVFYFGSSSDRGMGGAYEAGQTIKFSGSTYALSLYPSESFTIEYELLAYFLDTTVRFESGNTNVVTIDEDGTVVAIAEGTATVSAVIYQDGKRTYNSLSITITVNDPYTTSGPYLTSYKGNGGVVEIPADLSITEISVYAFSNYHYVPKDANDVISKEDPLATKPVPIGDDTITKVIIPEGVEVIDSYAFAMLTALKEVVFPSTLKKIDYYAFYGCRNLTTITFSSENNLQFVNNFAFYDCRLTSVDLSSVVAIGSYAFYGNAIRQLSLPASAQSLGSYAFEGNMSLIMLTLNAEKVKLGEGVFAYCGLQRVSVNASVIPANAFYGNTSLTTITLGADVAEISYNAFAGTSINTVSVSPMNDTFKAAGTYLTNKTGETILLVYPTATSVSSTTITSVGKGAFSGSKIKTVSLPNVTSVEDYAFYNCSALVSVSLGRLNSVGSYAFADCTALATLPAIASGIAATANTEAQNTTIGDHAFYNTNIATVSIPDNVEIGAYAFYMCESLASVTVGNNVVIGDYAFAAVTKLGYGRGLTALSLSGASTLYYYYNDLYVSNLSAIRLGDSVTIGTRAFQGAAATGVTLGNNAVIGDYAFYSASKLATIDLSGAVSIGSYAFSGLNQVIALRKSDDANKNNENLAKVSAIKTFADLNSTDLTFVNYATLKNAAAFTSAVLTNCEYLGNGAFYCMMYLTSVDLGSLTVLPDSAFGETDVSTIIGLSNLTSVGSYALAYTLITEADLSNATAIGARAFYSCTELASVILKEGASIGAGAFYGCSVLDTVENLNTATYIHANAFRETALTVADVSGAYFVGSYAFMDSAVTEVILSKNLDKYTYEEMLAFYRLLSEETGVDYANSVALTAAQSTGLGENPFAGCAVSAYKVRTDDGVIAPENYVLSETVQIINGSLYQTAANGGLQLISYPMLKADGTYEVAEGTVRVGALAFYKNQFLVSVDLPSTLVTLGDKAFYGCSALTVVTFKSLKAPILEELFDEDFFYSTMVNDDDEEVLRYYAFQVGYVDLTSGIRTGLGVAPFLMWNSGETTILFGANFVDYIGSIDKTIVMVSPSNGTNYDSLTFGLYFQSKIIGEAALTDAAKAFIAMVESLPSSISLNDETAVVAARAAYNSLTAEQYGLLSTQYAKLTNAENVIEYLKKNAGSEVPPDGGEEEPIGGNQGVVIALSVLTGVFALTTIAGVVLLVLMKKKSSAKNASEETDKQPMNDSEGK